MSQIILRTEWLQALETFSAETYRAVLSAIIACTQGHPVPEVPAEAAPVFLLIRAQIEADSAVRSSRRRAASRRWNKTDAPIITDMPATPDPADNADSSEISDNPEVSDPTEPTDTPDAMHMQCINNVDANRCSAHAVHMQNDAMHMQKEKNEKEIKKEKELPPAPPIEKEINKEKEKEKNALFLSSNRAREFLEFVTTDHAMLVAGAKNNFISPEQYAHIASVAFADWCVASESLNYTNPKVRQRFLAYVRTTLASLRETYPSLRFGTVTEKREALQQEIRKAVEHNSLPRDTLNRFFLYWAEPDPRGHLRLEQERTWSTPVRLKRWLQTSTPPLCNNSPTPLVNPSSSALS